MSIRRPLLVVVAALVAVAGAVVILPGTAGAETVKLDFSQDGTFWRAQQRAPIVDVPCQAPIPPDRCGKIGLPVANAPQVLDGNMVVGHAGGPTGPDDGDQFWIVSQPDLASLGPVDSVQRLTLTYTVAPDARGDFGAAVIKACNIVVPFGVGEGTNPWDDRPAVDCTAARAPKIQATKVIFDVTDLAQSWIDGKGFGIAIVPGLPGTSAVVNDSSRQPEVFPFQLTLISSNKFDANRQPVPGLAAAQIVYTPGADAFGSTDDGEVLGIDDFDTDEVGLGDIADTGGFDSGDDFASGGLDDGPVIDGTTSSPTRRSSPLLAAARSPGFAWGLLLLLPLLALAFWGAGNALGPLGDPVPVRQGGVARLVARRQAGRDIT